MPEYFVRATRNVILVRSALVEAESEEEAVTQFKADGHGIGYWQDLHDHGFFVELQDLKNCEVRVIRTATVREDGPHIQIVYNPEFTGGEGTGEVQSLYVPLAIYQRVISPGEVLTLYGLNPNDLIDCNDMEWHTQDGQPYEH